MAVKLRTAHHGKSGFTLMELMVVLVVIGIMTAMIIPEMKGSFEDALLRSSSRRLVDVFSLTYSQAVSANQLHRVRFEPQTGRYVVERRGLDKGQQEFIPVKDLPGGEGEVDSRISIEIRKPVENSADTLGNGGPVLADDAPILETAFAFYPDGTADAGEIVLRDREGFQLALRINPTTAHVQIVEVGRQ